MKGKCVLEEGCCSVQHVPADDEVCYIYNPVGNIILYYVCRWGINSAMNLVATFISAMM